jgi:hypothetical protein
MSAPIKSPLVLWANATTNKLQEGWQSTGVLDAIRFTQGDTVDIELHWLQNVTTTGYIHDEVIWPTSANITLALGLIDVEPSSGYFQLTYGSQTTGSLRAGVDAAALQTALNALSTIVADGGVTVSKTGTSYKVIWNNAIVPTYSLTVGNNDLFPSSSVAITTTRAGSVSVQPILQVHIKQSPVAAVTTWQNPDPVGDGMSLTYEGFQTTNWVYDTHSWLLDVTDKARNGSFNLSFVGTEPGYKSWTATFDLFGLSEQSIAATAYAAADAANKDFALVNGLFGLGAVKVTPTIYRLSQSVKHSFGFTISLDATNALGWSTKLGNLNLNTIEVETLLDGKPSANCVLEVEVEFSGQRKTIIQAQAYIVNDLIDSDVYSLVEFGSVMPVDSVVRYDTSQSLGSGQKSQARTNIGALGTADLASTTASIASLQSQISAVVFSTDVMDALNGALAPTALNPYLTKSSGDLNYAAVIHTHAIADVSGLQLTLDGYDTTIGGIESTVAGLTTSKANTYHTQAISTITNLTTVLADYDSRIAGFAPLHHIHDIADVTDLENQLAIITANNFSNIPTGGQKLALDNAESPDALNPFITESRLTTAISSLGTSGLATEIWVGTQLATLSSSISSGYLARQSANSTGFSGNLTTTLYPLELTVTQNGETYYIPARM